MVVKTVVEAQDILTGLGKASRRRLERKASVSRFVQANYTPYDGDEASFTGPTERSLHIKNCRRN